MLENTSDKRLDFKNFQGDSWPNAVIAVEDAKYFKEEVKRSEVTITRVGGESYEEEEVQVDGSETGVGGDINYTASYWISKQNFQSGRDGYLLEGAGREIEFTFKIDGEWAEKFNAIQGSDTQKITKLCEMHIEEVVLPSLRAR